MTPSTPVLVAIAIGLVLYAMRFDMLRSWRTVLAFAITCGAVLALSRPGLAVLQGLAVIVYAVLVLFGAEVLWAMRVADWHFVLAYRRARAEIHELPPARQVGVESFKRGWDAIPSTLEQVAAPDAAWQSLRDETIAELRCRRDAIDDPSRLTPEFVASTRATWDVLQRRFDGLIEERMSFWLLSPWS